MFDLNKFRKTGIAFAPWVMPNQEVTEFISYLDDCYVGNAHVVAKASEFKEFSEASVNESCPVFRHFMQDVILAPHFFEYALGCFDYAAGYFGEFPRLYSVNCFWTKPSHNEYVDTHRWHYDTDDNKQFALFMYGTDVYKINNGAHRYQIGTHVGNHIDHEWNDPPLPVVETVIGPAGTMFFEDPSGYHIGIRPDKLRMFAWARWGISEKPSSYIWDKLEPIPRALLGDRYPYDKQLREAISLVVA